MWSLDEQSQHHWEFVRMQYLCPYPSPAGSDPGVVPSLLCFNKLSRLNFEKG